MSSLLSIDYRGQFGDYTLLPESDEVMYDYEPETHGFRHVYVYRFVFRGHATCFAIAARRATSRATAACAAAAFALELCFNKGWIQRSTTE